VKDLVALAFTFQRHPETRTDGTWMFERLLLHFAYEMDTFAAQIDRRF
jgi:hypothetical protein